MFTGSLKNIYSWFNSVMRRPLISGLITLGLALTLIWLSVTGSVAEARPISITQSWPALAQTRPTMTKPKPTSEPKTITQGSQMKPNGFNPSDLEFDGSPSIVDSGTSERSPMRNSLTPSSDENKAVLKKLSQFFRGRTDGQKPDSSKSELSR